MSNTKMSNTKISAVLGVLLCCTNALAWNSFGHMTVAAIAYQSLTEDSRAKVKALLKLNPAYAQWIAGVAAADQDQVAFVMAATWPDAIKTMAGYKDDGETPSGPDSGRNIGYPDKLQHRYWHFIDLPFSPDGTRLIDPIPPNAQTQIAAFRMALAGSSTPIDVKSYDLVWLLHLVGDIHQPLHATSRFDKDQPKGDRGGNSVALCAAPCKNELHSFWDDLLGTSKDPKAAMKAASGMAEADAALAGITEESTWIAESFEAAKKSVYKRPIGVGAGPFTVDAGYRTSAHAVASERVALAGARLAGLINEALKDQSLQ